MDQNIKPEEIGNDFKSLAERLADVNDVVFLMSQLARVYEQKTNCKVEKIVWQRGESGMPDKYKIKVTNG